jgi:DNA-binding response OmpR family regulator
MDTKVLFIDDDVACRDIVGEALQGAGYNIIIAHDASDAMEKAQGQPLGLIILDLNLAGESGLTFMKFLRHNYPGVPVLIYTGMDHDDSTVLAMLDQGADQYLRKGSIEELIVTVGSYFRQLG